VEGKTKKKERLCLGTGSEENPFNSCPEDLVCHEAVPIIEGREEARGGKSRGSDPTSPWTRESSFIRVLERSSAEL